VPKLTFLPSGITREAREGQTIFEVGWEAEVGISSACVGKGTCGLCRVKIVEGADSLSQYNEVEDKHLGNLYHLTRLRLSCQCILSDQDVVVEVVQKKQRRRSFKKK
jgi:2Fe-2S ferredoxin